MNRKYAAFTVIKIKLHLYQYLSETNILNAKYILKNTHIRSVTKISNTLKEYPGPNVAST